jgi:hypothetical protein
MQCNYAYMSDLLRQICAPQKGPRARPGPKTFQCEGFVGFQTVGVCVWIQGILVLFITHILTTLLFLYMNMIFRVGLLSANALDILSLILCPYPTLNHLKAISPSFRACSTPFNSLERHQVSSAFNPYHSVPLRSHVLTPRFYRQTSNCEPQHHEFQNCDCSRRYRCPGRIRH